MKQVWKFTLHGSHQKWIPVRMPLNSKILCAHEQAESICLWAEVDPQAQEETRNFEVFGTGHEMPVRDRMYIGTAFIAGGAFVFHVYELEPKL